MSRRVVHYVAAGRAMLFECYHAELRAHYASKHEVEVPRVQGVHFYGSEPEVTPATMRVTRYAKPEPRRTSNLEAVTCPHCLEQVIAHAYIKLRKVKA